MKSIVYDFNTLNDNYNNYKYGPKTETPVPNCPSATEDMPLDDLDAIAQQIRQAFFHDQVRQPINIQKLILEINSIMRKADQNAELVYNNDNKSFNYKGKTYSIETFFDEKNGVALTDPPAYLLFENGQWINVMSSGIKVLANGDLQHESIGRSAETAQAQAKLDSYQPSYHYSKLYGEVNQTYINPIEKLAKKK